MIKLVGVVFALVLAAGFVQLFYATKIGYNIGWAYPLDVSLYDDQHAPQKHELLPLPSLIDLDGDGRLEVILATREPSVVMIRPSYDNLPGYKSTGLDVTSLETKSSRHSSKSELSWPVPRVLVSRSLRGALSVAFGRQAVSMTTGTVTIDSRSVNIVVVVTNGWSILCYSSEMQLLWEASVTMSISADQSFREVAVLIVDVPMRVGDSGTVIVGARLQGRSVVCCAL